MMTNLKRRMQHKRLQGLCQWYNQTEGKDKLNRCDFKCALKVVNVRDRRRSTGRLFHARGPATAKARSPMVERRVAGTRTSAVWMQNVVDDVSLRLTAAGLIIIRLEYPFQHPKLLTVRNNNVKVKLHTLDTTPLRIVKHHRRSAQVWHVFSRDFTVLPAHPHVHPQSVW